MDGLTEAQVDILLRAVSNAPSVHNTQPWEIDVTERTIGLFQRKVDLPSHDPVGRDRMISCGAALANLELAVRHLGFDSNVDILPGSADRDAIGLVTAGRPRPATEEEDQLYQAIARRRSYRYQFEPKPVPNTLAAAIAGLARQPGVESHLLTAPAQIATLASMLGSAARALRADRIYQRELTAWLASPSEPAPEHGDGIPTGALGNGWLPAGLVRTNTPMPDDYVLAERIAAETLLIVTTSANTVADQVAAGRVLQRAWLSVTAAGMAASVITQPLHLSGFPEELRDRLALPGLPRALFRFGYPVRVLPAVPRKPYRALLRHHRRLDAR
ncbi:hypothetical protein EV191_10470 [Tamaricihabitans halophyticus]|uniref:Nitroreductase family protein n=1 Tax=Tamaricihabitans halophyticus TaxID=1262583 RepID=A0A4R2QU63_9PSEU|nr:nitroreductase [Tamaricihabitans halophyticus]TCP53503.1 hypothetical protein EV191_10470 [Tamaricihabitans halophyticus]